MSARLLVLLAVTASLGVVAVVGAQDAPPQVPPSVSEYSCSDTTYTNGSQYEKNLNDLVSTLSTAAAANGNGWFRDGSVGAPPDQATGLIMCYADANITQCLDCLRNASLGDLRGVCPNSRGMSVHYGECLLRYADADFLGTADTGSVLVAGTAPAPDGTDVASMNKARGRLLSYLANNTGERPLRFMYENWAYLDEHRDAHLVYGLAQCTRDLRPSECTRCLVDQLAMASSVLTNSTRGSLRGLSCYMRFQLNHPIDIIPGLGPAPAPSPHPLGPAPAPPPPDSPQPSGAAAAPPPGSKQGSKTPLIAALAAAAWTVAALVVARV